MNKKIFISLGIIAFLLLIIFFISNRNRFSSIDVPKFEGSAEEIIINRQKSSYKIFKKDGKWLISEQGKNDKTYPADENKIAEIEKKVKDLKIDSLVSKKDYYKRYDLTPDKFIELILKKGGKVVRKVVFGKRDSLNSHTFIRIDDKPEIYLAEGTYHILLDKPMDDFRNKEIFKISSDAISSFEINNKGKVFSFVKKTVEKSIDDKEKKEKGDDKKPKKVKEELWICKGYETITLNKNSIDAILQTFINLSASSYPDINKEMVNRPICSIKIKAYDKEIALNILYKDKENKYIANSSESPYVFSLDEWKVQKLFIDTIDSVKERSQ